jgi:type IV secretory pathway VirD2 relaxase
VSRSDDDRPFRLCPRAPRRSGDEARPWANAFQALMQVARMSSKGSKKKPKAAAAGSSSKQYQQRCAVRVTYAPKRGAGQWGAHGRYLARESAVRSEEGRGTGFGPQGESVELSSTLDGWQRAGDPRLFKIIVSPEFGDRMDLEAHTRALLERMERDLGTRLDWVAVIHHNTEHAHVHVALRGVTNDGRPLRLNPDYIRHGIRRQAEDLCTAQLGYRTELDTMEAERREVGQQRFTSLDRILLRESTHAAVNPDDAAYFVVTKDASTAGLAGAARSRERHLALRLKALTVMGLAEEVNPGTWRVRRDFGQVLRDMQRVGDRQRMLADHGSLRSDERLPIVVTPWKTVTQLEGRVLLHAEEEATGRPYLLLEGTDGKVHYLSHNAEIDTARHQGLLRTNAFVRLRKEVVSGRARLSAKDLGDAEQYLSNRTDLQETARRLMDRGIQLSEPQWGGWLGRYQAALLSQSHQVVQEAARARLPQRLNRGRE